MASRYVCVSCKKTVTATKNDRYRTHTNGAGERCDMSSEEIPEHILASPAGPGDDPGVPKEGVDFAVCPHCGRRVKVTRLGYFEQHETTLRGGDRCPVGGVRVKHARRQETHLLPGDKPASPDPKVRDSEPEQMAQAKAALAGPPPHEINLARDPMSAGSAASSASTISSSPESATTSMSSPSGTAGPGTSSDAPGSPAEPAAAGSDLPALPPVRQPAGTVQQPASHISQPFPAPARIRLADSMSERGKEIAARLRETFYAYTNRNATDNRSAQKTLGPSEIGSPCDRQLAMKLLGVRPVNPQEGWAPFVGTAVHVELAKMFEWANGSGSGRYLTEMSVQIGSNLVPRGTLDVYDGVLYMVGDNKLMGRYSLDKLIQEGLSETYRVQLHTYGLGAIRAGLKVKEVALIAWPRQESSLDKLYVHVEPYDKTIAERAIARVEKIAKEIRTARDDTGALAPDIPADIMYLAQVFPAGDDCKWCPFHLKGDKEMKRGCPGK